MRRAARTPFVALVTPYSFARTQRLADELEALGYETMIVDHPSLADRALEADACVIVLTPDGWRDPAIVAVMRERPPTIIPVLAAPMDPPRAAWSSEPIPMRGSAREVAAAVADAVDAALDPRARSDAYGRSNPGASYGGNRPGAYGRGAGQPISRPRGGYADERTIRSSRPNPVDFPPGINGGFGVPSNAAAKPTKTSGSAGRAIGILLAVLVVLGGLGFAGYKYRTKLLGKFFAQQSTGAAVMQPYSATAPGPGCDKGKGQWALPKDHSFYSTACQADTLLVTQTKSSATLAEVDFLGTGLKLPAAYHMQVTATITSGDQHTVVGMIVHHQTPTGGHVFWASSDTSWAFQVASASDGKLGLPLRRGFLPQATKTFTLAVDVSGVVMTFSINGKAVTHVTETSYTTSDSVALILAAGDAKPKLPIAAQFSQFQFTPQPDPTLTTDQAVATAVAENNAIPKTYTAAVPGPGCDKGQAQWARPSYYDETGVTVTCQSAGVKIVAPANNGGDIGFYGIKGTLIKDTRYSVTVTITPADANSCGGVTTYDTQNPGYIYIVCGNGAYLMLGYNPTTKQTTTLDSSGIGTMPGGPSYVVVITENSPSHAVKINGFTRPAVSDKNATSTDHITLFSLALGNAPSTVTFSHFTFTDQS